MNGHQRRQAEGSDRHTREPEIGNSRCARHRRRRYHHEPVDFPIPRIAFPLGRYGITRTPDLDLAAYGYLSLCARRCTRAYGVAVSMAR
jgi:hypothetical protein